MDARLQRRVQRYGWDKASGEYSRFDDAARDAACDEYLRSIEPYRRGDGYAIPGEFVIARGRRTS